MAQSLSRVLLHVVFSTKKRVAMIPPDLEPELHAFAAGACRKAGSEACAPFSRQGGADVRAVLCKD